MDYKKLVPFKIICRSKKELELTVKFLKKYVNKDMSFLLRWSFTNFIQVKVDHKFDGAWCSILCEQCEHASTNYCRDIFFKEYTIYQIIGNPLKKFIEEMEALNDKKL